MFLMKKLNHKVVFIPTWLRQVQKVYGFDDKELLNLSKLLDILCVEDVAKYFAANNIFYSNDNFTSKKSYLNENKYFVFIIIRYLSNTTNKTADILFLFMGN